MLANLDSICIKTSFCLRQIRDGYEYKFIEKIVEQVSREINPVCLHVADYPVGLESQVLQVRWLLDVGTDDGVHMLGFHGMGGVGKSNKCGLEHLQSILLTKIHGDGEGHQHNKLSRKSYNDT